MGGRVVVLLEESHCIFVQLVYAIQYGCIHYFSFYKAYFFFENKKILFIYKGKHALLCWEKCLEMPMITGLCAHLKLEKVCP